MQNVQEYIRNDVRPISDSVATCRSQPMKNDHVTTMVPPRGESSLSRERKTRQLVRCEWTINIGSRQTTSIEGNRRDGKKKLCAIRRSFDGKTLNFSHAIFIDRCYCHREAAVMTDDDARTFLFTLDILRIAYIYIHTHVSIYFASIRVVWISTLRRFVSRFVSRCSTRNCLDWSNVVSSDAYDRYY